jgi:hypothetical protein
MKKDAVDRELEQMVRGMRAVRRKRFVANCVAMGAALPSALGSGLLLARLLHGEHEIPVVAFMVPVVLGAVVYAGVQRVLLPKDPDL